MFVQVSEASSEASQRTTLALRRIRALLASHALDVKFAALKRAVKAFDPNQPRVPAGNPNGGQWTDGGSTPASLGEDGAGGAARDDQRSDLVVLASHTPGGDGDEPPKVPRERRRTSRARTRILKQVGLWLARQVVTKRIKALLTILDQAGWLEPSIDIIRTFADPPKSLEALQRSASPKEAGYDDHHIVEKTPALRDGYPRSRVNGPENLVRIPRLKHWLINAWLETPNEEYEWKTPRVHMRGKDWNTRYRIGIRVLVRFGVLKK